MQFKANASCGIVVFAIVGLPLSAVADAGASGRGDFPTTFPAAAGAPPLPMAPVLAAKSTDALPKSRDALFDDDEPNNDSEPPPATKESLFLDDQSVKSSSGGQAAGGGQGGAIKGFVENVMAYTTSRPRHWSEMMFRADLTAQGDLGSAVKWKMGARFDYDATYSLADYYPRAVANDQRFNVTSRENYLDIGAGDWDFRLGRQQVVWGEMVGLLFGDVVSAKDMRQFILPDFEILRIPQWAARAEYFKDDFHAELLWIPVASYDDIGKPGSQFFNYTLPAPAGVATVFRNEKTPSRNLSNTNYGLRLSVLRDGWDVAAFAYRSMSVAPTFYREIVQSPQPTVVYQAQHDRITQYGATLAKDLGSVVFKAEAVYTKGMKYQVTNLSDADGVVPQDTLNWVVGLDYNEIADTRINLQFFQSHFFDRHPDIIQSTNENGYSVLLNRKFGDKVEAQVLLIASLNRSDWMLRPRASWNFEKNWRLAFGADVFKGPPLGYFGRYDNSDRVYTELRYSF
ncbi:MAG TPA: hypothetical protein PLS67_03065 [Accumulibacter sp.]|jgi:hypothetical protein|nr:hypothetical protein [Accumulibacter sp.]HQC79490.1 hypothetical protein [Accumulibacter sp.]